MCLVTLNEEITGIMKEFLNCRKNEKKMEEKKEEIKGEPEIKKSNFLCAQLIPLADRLGRILSDMSLQFLSIAYQDYYSPTEPILIPKFPGVPNSISPNESNLKNKMRCQIPLMATPGDLHFLSRITDGSPPNEVHVHEIIVSGIDSSGQPMNLNTLNRIGQNISPDINQTRPNEGNPKVETGCQTENCWQSNNNWTQEEIWIAEEEMEKESEFLSNKSHTKK